MSEYAAWLDVLPEALRDSATGEALQAIVDLDLGQHRAAARLWTGLSRAFPPRTAGCPQGSTGNPPRMLADSWRSLRDARVPPMDSVDDPLRQCRFTVKNQPRGSIPDVV